EIGALTIVGVHGLKKALVVHLRAGRDAVHFQASLRPFQAAGYQVPVPRAQTCRLKNEGQSFYAFTQFFFILPLFSTAHHWRSHLAHNSGPSQEQFAAPSTDAPISGFGSLQLFWLGLLGGVYVGFTLRALQCSLYRSRKEI